MGKWDAHSAHRWQNALNAAHTAEFTMNTMTERQLPTHDEHTYEALDAELYHKGHGGEMLSRRVGNNTKLERGPGNTIALRLHDTNILTYYPDNRVILNAGSWFTVTTKNRMNAFLGWYTVHSVNGEWQVKVINRIWDQNYQSAYVEVTIPFENGMAINARTHELVHSPNDYLTSLDDTIVMREVTDITRNLSIQARTLEDKSEDGTIIRDDIETSLRLLNAFQDQRKALVAKIHSLESSMDWATERLEHVITTSLEAHAERFLEQRESRENIPGQRRMRDLI